MLYEHQLIKKQMPTRQAGENPQNEELIPRSKWFICLNSQQADILNRQMRACLFIKYVVTSRLYNSIFPDLKK
jgi:hypothetical protein